MKKLFTLIAMVAITLMSYAQNQVFWSNGEILFATPVKGIDSLNYVLDNSVASDTLQLILPHRLVEKKVNTEALNETFTGAGTWEFWPSADTYYNQVTVKVDLTEMEEAHAGELKNLNDTILKRENTIAEKEKEISAKDSTIAENEKVIGEKETIIAEQKEVIDSISDYYSTYNTGELEIDSNGWYSFNNHQFTVFVDVKDTTFVHDTTIVTKVDTVEVEKIVEVQVPVYNCVGGLGYVDLGLPSGTLWASANVGAENPWEFGEYYAWAEIEEKVEYTIENYAAFQNLGENIKEQLKDAMMDAIFSGSMSDVIKDLITGNINPFNPKNPGSIDFSSITDLLSKLPEIAGPLADALKDVVGGLTEETELIAFKDAARMSLGKKWCMPTKEQLQELLDNCEWTYGKMEGVDGWTVTGSNGNSIFLPAAGMKKDGTLTTDGGYYWSKTGSELSAYSLTAKHFTISGILGDSWFAEAADKILEALGAQDKLNEASRTVAPCVDLYIGKTIRPVYIGK